MMTTSSTTTTRRRWRRRKHRKGLLLLAIPLLSSFIYLFSVDFNFYLNQIIVTNNNENAITNVEYEYNDNAAEFSSSSSLRNDGTKILSLQSTSNSTPNNKSSYNNNNNITTFLPLQNMPKGYGEIYSGMWYQSISTMLQLNFTHAHTLEMISFLSFVSDEKRNHHRRPLMTTDWFDFSVEHLSKYVKHYFEEEEEEESVVVVQRRVGELIRGYIDKSLEKKRMEMMEQQWWWYDDSLSTVVKIGTTATATKNDTQPNLSSAAAAEAAAALRHTIAIIPIRIEETNHQNTSSSNPQQQQHHDDIDHYGEYNQHHLSILQLTATITSLWKHHFPRIVIAGVSSSERQAFQSMLHIFQQQQQQQHYFKVLPMELVYVHMEGRKKEWRNVPKMAMLEFQRAVRESKRPQLLEEDNVVGTKDGRDKRNETITTSSSTAERNNNNNNNNSNSSDNNFVTSWLGTNPQQWQHIYFSEPDLLLQTRSTALPSIIREINKGHVLTAHRLQPIPHMRQFADVIDAAIVQHQQQQEQSSTTNHHHDVVSLVRYMNRNTLPDHGPFEQIQVLNPHTTSCCDRGNFFPANVENSKEPIQARKQFGCPGTFELCGFRKYKEFQRQRRGVGSGSGIGGGGSEEEEEEDSSNHHWKDILEAHKLLIPYNLIALGEGYGTGIPLVHAHQRVCKVQQEVCL